MFQVLAVVALIAVSCPSAFAQGGTIVVSPDTYWSDCALPGGPGLLAYFVVHALAPGVTASEFAAPRPACMDAVWLGDTQVFGVTIGDSQTGVSIGYGACLATPVHVLTILYYAEFEVLPCTCYPVLPAPASGASTPLAVDCGNNLLPANGERAVVNPDPNCGYCLPVIDCRPCGTVGTESATWGSVKAIYAE